MPRLGAGVGENVREEEEEEEAGEELDNDSSPSLRAVDQPRGQARPGRMQPRQRVGKAEQEIL